MSKETLYVYITDIPAYLNGDRDYSLGIESTPPDDNMAKIGRYGDRLYIDEVYVECTHSIKYMTELALQKLSNKEKDILAEKQRELERIEEVRSSLLAIEYFDPESQS